MRATIGARLESRPVATSSADLVVTEVATTTLSPAFVGPEMPLAVPQPPSPPQVSFETLGPGFRYPELARPEGSSFSHDAMCA
jgi:hypothetical protein